MTTPHISRRNPLHARIGIIGVGHHTYWDQFEGLLDEMYRKMKVLGDRVTANGAEVEMFSVVDTATAAYDELPKVQAADLDLLFVDMVTYATSSTFGVLIRNLNVPIVLVALQPLKAMDYVNGSTYMQLCNDDFCSVPEFTGVAIRMGKKPPPVILGHEEGDPVADAEISRWCNIAKALHDLRRGRFGLMGHVLESMLDMHTDPTAVTATFGCHIPLIEPHDLMRHFEAATGAQIAEKLKEIEGFFDFPDPISDPITRKATPEDLQMAAKTMVALEGLIDEKNLTGLAYYYEADEGSQMRKLVTNLIVGNSLLTGAGFPMCGEFDIKTCLAMLIMDRLGIGGSFAEFHPVDFAQDTILVGHDGPHHINIADGRPVLRSLIKYHGKPGSGVGVEFKIKTGPITMLSIGQNAVGGFKFVIAEGQSEDFPIPPTGNTNTHGRFGKDVRKFLCDWAAEGPTHHFALGIGHHAEDLVRIAEILDIEYAVVREE
ncbi:L-fucose/L-arabinose isomerase family protein [Kiritimatiellaeota bacterium B1221]|nr:L-fucose/L-arabinose isomerase family protein [Kiritimatiellaeota bacterium B1221]